MALANHTKGLPSAALCMWGSSLANAALFALFFLLDPSVRSVVFCNTDLDALPLSIERCHEPLDYSDTAVHEFFRNILKDKGHLEIVGRETQDGRRSPLST